MQAVNVPRMDEWMEGRKSIRKSDDPNISDLINDFSLLVSSLLVWFG